MNNDKRLEIRLPNDLYVQFSKICTDIGCTMSDFVRTKIEEVCTDKPKVDLTNTNLNDRDAMMVKLEEYKAASPLTEPVSPPAKMSGILAYAIRDKDMYR